MGDNPVTISRPRRLLGKRLAPRPRSEVECVDEMDKRSVRDLAGKYQDEPLWDELMEAIERCRVEAEADGVE